MKEKFNLIVCQIIVVFVSIFTVACAKMDGYCASIAVDAGASQSILNGVNAFGSGSFNFSTMNPAMLPALYDNINMNLYQTFGYDVNDAIDYGADNLTSWATGQRDNPLNGASTISVSTADWLASKLFQAGATASSVLSTGYEYFAQSIPQWGENAKQFFIGKKNEITGAIESAGANVVTKITAGGLAAYASINQALQDNGSIYNLTESDLPMYGNTFDFFFVENLFDSNAPILRMHMVLNYDCVLVSPNYIDNNNVFTKLDGPKFYYIKSGDEWLDCISCTVVDSYGHLVSNDASKVYFNSTDSDIINGVTVYHGNFAYDGYYARSASTIPPTYYFGTDFFNSDVKKSELLSILNSGESYIPIGYSYNYASNALSLSLKNQLERLLDNYVDSLTLQRINDIVSSIPTTVQDGVIVANPTQEVVDELTSVVDDAITDSATYEEVFDAYYEDAIDVPVPPDPEPVTPNYTGTLVPTPFPGDAFSPINGGIDSVFSMASLFEPIFYVFSAFSGLFSLWLIVPFVLLFGILIKLLK